MTASSTLSVFPDVNVWIALSSTRHAHHMRAVEWLRAAGEARLFFCRFTQLSFLRLLTTEAVMGRDTLTQIQAWSEYDAWLKSDIAALIDEPAQIEPAFRSLTQKPRSSAKEWADPYLAAFSMAAGLRLVTFDQALSSRLRDAILLRV
jgi:toxin-antitoxin system PIN domain toxin